jgi:hypothetical protein
MSPCRVVPDVGLVPAVPAGAAVGVATQYRAPLASCSTRTLPVPHRGAGVLAPKGSPSVGSAGAEVS